MSATSITMPQRKYLLKVSGHRQQTTPEMMAGKEMHENMLEGYKTLAKYGVRRFERDLYNGKEIKLQELSLCSSLYGMLGIIDKFIIQYTKDGNINICITDLKPRYTPSYLKQIFVYGMILSDRNCLIAYDTRTPRAKRKKRITIRLYPKHRFNLNITLNLEFYLYTKNNIFTIKMLENGKPTEFAQGICTTILKDAKRKRELHKMGIYYLHMFPLCKDCKRLESYCSLWEICQKAPHVPSTKSAQYFIGSNKLLRKTKPLIKR